MELTLRQVNSSFWVGKKVFLTGHTGFKGSWLSIWLKALRADVVGFSLESAATNPSLYTVARVNEDVTSLMGDVRDYEALHDAILAAKPDIVIHMAAQSLVRESYRAPIESYSTNVMGTVNILEAVRRVGTARAVINVTSDKCYENQTGEVAFAEDAAMGGYDPYSSSKGCSELVTTAFRRSYFHDGRVAIASARAGNVIGGGDWAPDRLVPDVLRAFEKGKSVFIRNPGATRPWQHVLEPLSGYLLLAESLYEHGALYAEGWNFGPGNQNVRDVRWIVDQMARNWGRGARWTHDACDHPYEATHLSLNAAKAAHRLGWKPRWDLLKTLTMISEWHEHWLSGKDPKRKCLDQIMDYETSEFL